MECGAEQRLTSGWLNRAVQAHAAARRPQRRRPLHRRRPAPAPARPDPGRRLRPAKLPAARSPTSTPASSPCTRTTRSPAPPSREGLQERGFTGAQLGGDTKAGGKRYAFPALAAAAGHLLAAPDGPRIAAMELGGWDTHAAQAQRLAAPLKQLDDGLVAMRDALGDAWRKTAVLVITEFGRTVRVNGTGGTDHGTGTVAFVAGGAVAGGRVRADWPGLAPGQLLEGRDLAAQPGLPRPRQRPARRPPPPAPPPPSPAPSPTATPPPPSPASSAPDPKLTTPRARPHDSDHAGPPDPSTRD